MESIGRVEVPREVCVAALSTKSRGRQGQRSGDNRMGSRWCLAVLLAVVMLAAGCAVTVDGAAQPAPNSTPRLLTGPTIKRVLLGKSALSRIVEQPLNIDPHFPSRFGGPETLLGDRSAWPVGCIGVAVMMQHSVYRFSNVKNVAIETWRPASLSAAVTRVKEGVVSLPTAADADDLFAKFSRQWQRCNDRRCPCRAGCSGSRSRSLTYKWPHLF